MKNIGILAAFLLCPLLFTAQENQGLAEKSILWPGGKSRTAYAVVVGISDYQNEGIPDLRFAHRDAEAFVDYLKSDSGGNLTDDQILVLINEEATTANIAAAMDWLIERTGEGDQAIIYFSGHGDIETKTAAQHGFLLTYDSPPTTYIAGAYPLFYLQSVISTLSISKNARVLIVTDACHSGKLAGSSIGGTQATSAALSKQFASEIKIMSCQPDEYSVEGEQWGGGRGAFSFHLIDGMKGLADKNGDYQINLLELERYLEETVPAEVAPESQIPMTIGNKGSIIAYIDGEELDKLIKAKMVASPEMAMVSSRGIEDDILAMADSQTVCQYRKYQHTLKNGPLMVESISASDIESETFSANQYYELLTGKEILKPIFGQMKRQLAVALQEEAQQVINSYLNISHLQIASVSGDDHEEMKFNINHARYLARAIELLGQNHYMHGDLRSRQLYFEAKADFIHSYLDHTLRDSLVRSSLKKLKEGLTFQPRAPHILVELGKVYSVKKKYNKAINYYEQAVELSPAWPIPYYMLALDFTNIGEFEKAATYAQKVLILQPRFENAFGALMYAWYMLEEYDRIIALCQQTIEKMPDYLAAYLELGLAYLTEGRNMEAELILLRALKTAPDKSLVYSYLGEAYLTQQKYNAAEKILKKAIQLDSLDSYPYQVLAGIYLEQNKLDEAKKILLQILEFNPGNDLISGQIGLICLQKKEFDEALNYMIKAYTIAPEFTLNQFNFFCYHYTTGWEKEASYWLETAFQNGLCDYLEHQEIGFTDCFKEVSTSKEFRALKKIYCNN